VRNTFLVTYDICEDRRLAKVHKTMRGFEDHLQYSVFECQFTLVTHPVFGYRVGYRGVLEIQTRRRRETGTIAHAVSVAGLGRSGGATDGSSPRDCDGYDATPRALFAVETRSGVSLNS